MEVTIFVIAGLITNECRFHLFLDANSVKHAYATREMQTYCDNKIE